MALFEDGRLTVHNVGAPSFRQTMRQVTGQTLRVPALAERLASSGGQVAYSDVSPGAAYFLDPDHFGTVLHRAGSFGPGGAALTGAAHLAVTHDLAGDIEMARRFCAEVVPSDAHTLSILWLANPDLTLHHEPLGSPEHLQAPQGDGRAGEEVLDAVRRRTRIASTRWYWSDRIMGTRRSVARSTSADGCRKMVWRPSCGTAGSPSPSQGTSALIYATEKARPAPRRSVPAHATRAVGRRDPDRRDAGGYGPLGEDAVRGHRYGASRRAQRLRCASPEHAGWSRTAKARRDRQGSSWRIGTAGNATLPGARSSRFWPAAGSSARPAWSISPRRSWAFSASLWIASMALQLPQDNNRMERPVLAFWTGRRGSRIKARTHGWVAQPG